MEEKRTLNNRYVLDDEIGRGGMGVVYRASDRQLNRIVAVKILPAEFIHNQQFTARFKSEVQHTSQLQHTNIVSVYDVGIDDNTHYYVMQYIDGQDLKSYLSLHGTLSVSDMCKMLLPIANALDYAHECGIIHRDIKPENILIDKQGVPRLTDFGIARSREGTRMTTGMVGTPEYMSPEQAKGDDVDGRSDQYSLAIVAYEMLTGTTPFRSSTAQPWAIVNKHINEAPPDPRSIASSLTSYISTVLLKGLAKTPAERFISCSDFIDFFLKPSNTSLHITDSTFAKWSVSLIEISATKKIEIIVMICKDTGWLLKQAKEAVESLPCIISSGIQWLEAKRLVEKYENARCRLSIFDQAGKEHYISPASGSLSIPVTHPVENTKPKEQEKKNIGRRFAEFLFNIAFMALVFWWLSPYISPYIIKQLEDISKKQQEQTSMDEAAKILGDASTKMMQDLNYRDKTTYKIKGDMSVNDCADTIGTWIVVDEKAKQFKLPDDYIERLKNLRNSGHIYNKIVVDNVDDKWTILIDDQYTTDATYQDGLLLFNKKFDNAEGIWYDKKSKTLIFDTGLDPTGFYRVVLQYYKEQF